MDVWGFLATVGWSAVGAWTVIVGLWALGIYLSLRLLYSVIWRAVRRGLREYHGSPTAATPALYPPQWTEPAKHREPKAPKSPPPLRPEAGPRDWKPGGSLFE